MAVAAAIEELAMMTYHTAHDRRRCSLHTTDWTVNGLAD